MGTSPAIAAEPMLQWFRFSHLKGDLQVVSSWFATLATELTIYTPRTAERTVALRKLLEAKDAAVRNMLPQQPVPTIAPEPDRPRNGIPQLKDSLGE